MIYSAKPFGSEDALSLAFYCRFRKTKYKFSNTTVYEDLGGGGVFFGFVCFFVFARWKNIFMAKYLLIMIVKSFVISSVHIIVVNI